MGYGYRPYRGSGRRSGPPASRGRSVLKGIIALLLVLLAVGVGVLVYLQQYLVYTDKGVVLDLPWAQEEEQTPDPSQDQEEEEEPQESQVVVEDPGPEAAQYLHAVQLPLSALTDSTAVSQMEQWGGNAVVLDMKTDSGALSYVSAVPLAVSCGASGSDTAVNEAIQALAAQDGVYLIARVSCFEDNTAGMDHDLAILTNSGYRWQGPDDNRWINPTHEAVRQYIVDVCVELAQMGFDEILLDHASFPPEGNLDWIRKGENYDAASFSTIIAGFYDQVETALEPTGTAVSVVTTSAALTGTDVNSGQTAANLFAGSRRVWIAPAEGESLETLTALVPQGQEGRLVLMTDAAGGAQENWALMYR